MEHSSPTTDTRVAGTEAAAAPADVIAPDARWWRDAVVYQVYVRSFADCNGDGYGDLAGVLEHLPYLLQRPRGRCHLVHPLVPRRRWPTPATTSPTTAPSIPAFGTLAQAERLIEEALALGIRTIIDVVPNHVSDQHPWFQAALASGTGSSERARFEFREGKGEDRRATAERVAVDLRRVGPADRARPTPTAQPGEWYLHLFAPEQPDLNWQHPEVWAEHEDILRFWFDRGVAGVRIDSAALLVKDPTLPEERPDAAPGEHPFTDRDELHEIYRRWRAIADSYDEPRMLVGEVWLPDVERFVRYLRPDELHTAFNFDFLSCPWEPGPMRRSITDALAAHAPVDAPATWVLSNHDVTRHVTRYGRADTSFAFEAKRARRHPDRSHAWHPPRACRCAARDGAPRLDVHLSGRGARPARGRGHPRRSPPGSGCGCRSGGVDPGRDGCRVPCPGPETGLPTASAATGPRLRSARRLGAADGGGRSRRTEARCSRSTARACAYVAPTRGWATPASAGSRDPESVLIFARGDRFVCLVNFGPEPVELPAGSSVLISSNELEGGSLPQGDPRRSGCARRERTRTVLTGHLPPDRNTCNRG